MKPSMVRSETLAAPISTSRLLVPVLATLMVAAMTPIFSVQVPPLEDYINHLARMYVLTNLDNDPLLAKFYGVQWAVIPNLVMDLIVPFFGRHMNIYLAGELFIGLTLAIQVTGCFALHYAIHRRWSAWPLVGFLFVYNNILLFGFMNYLFGLGVTLWGLAAWIMLRDKSVWLRLLVSTATVLLLFLCHLFDVGVYGMGLMCYEGWLLHRETRAGRRPARRLILRDVIAFGVPFLPVLPLMMISPTMGLITDYDWESTGKLDGIYYIFQNYSDLFDLSVMALVIAGVIWAARTRMISLHPVGWWLLALGIVVFMAMPRQFFSSWEADQRLPIALVFLLICFVDFRDASRWGRYFLYVFVLGVACARFASVFLVWQQLDHTYSDFRLSVGMIDPGSTVLVAYSDEPSGSDALNTPLAHAACFAMLERSSLVSTAFSVAGKQVLTVKPKYHDRVDNLDGDPPTVSQLIAAANQDRATQRDNEFYWSHWTEQFEYVYVLYTDNGANPAPDLMKLVYQGPHFQLYKVNQASEEE